MQKPNFKITEPTFDYIKNIELPKIFESNSNNPPIDEIQLTIEKGDRCFKFETEIKIVKGMAKYQSIAYGFNEEFSLKNSIRTWQVPKGTPDVHITLGGNSSGMRTSGEISLIEENYRKLQSTYFRVVLPKPKQRDDVDNFLLGECYNYENTVSRGFTSFSCNNNLFHLFTYYNEERPSLIIDSMSLINSFELETSIDAILFSLGLISGSVAGEEMFILQSDSNEFTNISGFRFTWLKDTIETGMKIVDPDLFSQLQKLDRVTGHITPETFSRLTTNAVRDVRFMRAIKIISYANTYPLEIQASSYSVALETVKNILLEENRETTNPFKNKKNAQETIKKLKALIDEMDDEEFNNKTVVLKKLDQLNQMTNRDGFTLAFDLLNFKLTESDRWALDRRNDFLHGRIPFEEESNEIQTIELRALTYKLHFLVVGLLLKHSGFTGMVRNNPMYFKLLQGIHEKDDFLFRHI